LIKASYVYPDWVENKIFDVQNRAPNQPSCDYSVYHLKQLFQRHGVDLSTWDINSPETSDIVLYHDVPPKLPKKSDREKSFLLLMEPVVVKPRNWDARNHAPFKKVFTWNDDWVDNQKYIQLRYAFQLPKTIDKQARRQKLCTTIIGRKTSKHPTELYSKRVEAIRWFERHHPEAFEFYGNGWQTRSFIDRYVLRKPVFTSYRGKVASKQDVLKTFRFAICFENTNGSPGYITEKIFDCFFAGCIPIYWGAPNIADLIPPACFIDFRQFESYDALYNHIIHMDEATCQAYRESIEQFITGPGAIPFSTEYFANTIVNTVCGLNPAMQ